MVPPRVVGISCIAVALLALVAIGASRSTAFSADAYRAWVIGISAETTEAEARGVRPPEPYTGLHPIAILAVQDYAAAQRTYADAEAARQAGDPQKAQSLTEDGELRERGARLKLAMLLDLMQTVDAARER